MECAGATTVGSRVILLLTALSQRIHRGTKTGADREEGPERRGQEEEEKEHMHGQPHSNNSRGSHLPSNGRSGHLTGSSNSNSGDHKESLQAEDKLELGRRGRRHRRPCTIQDRDRRRSIDMMRRQGQLC